MDKQFPECLLLQRRGWLKLKKEHNAPARPTPLSKQGYFDPETSEGGGPDRKPNTICQTDQQSGSVIKGSNNWQTDRAMEKHFPECLLLQKRGWLNLKKGYNAPARPTPLSKLGNFDPETSEGGRARSKTKHNMPDRPAIRQRNKRICLDWTTKRRGAMINLNLTKCEGLYPRSTNKHWTLKSKGRVRLCCHAPADYSIKPEVPKYIKLRGSVRPERQGTLQYIFFFFFYNTVQYI